MNFTSEIVDLRVVLRLKFFKVGAALLSLLNFGQILFTSLFKLSLHIIMLVHSLETVGICSYTLLLYVMTMLRYLLLLTIVVSALRRFLIFDILKLLILLSQ